MRLVTFGCSNTAGEGLEDTYDPVSGNQLIDTSKFAWPQLLADQMNLESVNVAQGGSSNKQIAWTIQNFKFQKDDVVIIMWTFPNRWCVITEPMPSLPPVFPHENKIGPWMTKKKLKFKDSISDRYYRSFHNDFDSLVDMYTRIEYISNMLNNLSIKSFHATCADRPDVQKFFAWFTTKLLQTSPQNSWIDTAVDNDHPGPASHRLIAEKMHNEIADIRYDN